jgi:hypothetical protein
MQGGEEMEDLLGMNLGTFQHILQPTEHLWFAI